jgi:hypothetical protein
MPGKIGQDTDKTQAKYQLSLGDPGAVGGWCDGFVPPVILLMPS